MCLLSRVCVSSLWLIFLVKVVMYYLLKMNDVLCVVICVVVLCELVMRLVLGRFMRCFCGCFLGLEIEF